MISGAEGRGLNRRGQAAYGLAEAGLSGAEFLLQVYLLELYLVPDLARAAAMDGARPRDGSYFGFVKMGHKVSRAAGLILAGTLLSSIGFDPSAVEQAPGVPFRLALLFGPGVGLFFLVGAAALSGLQLPDDPLPPQFTPASV